MTWEVPQVIHRRVMHGCSIGAVGLALALAPLSAASASSHKPKHHKPPHHSTTTTKPQKGSNTGSALCKDLRAEQASSSTLGGAIASAIESGNFATTQKDLLAAFNSDLKEASPALTQLKSAPSNVQSAMKGLITFINTFKTDVAKATSVSSLESSFTTLGTNPQLKSESATVAAYVTGQCGSVTTPTTAPAVP
jgi:hypothetical protein